eukprot:scaffold4707_cov164-Amphora_coffeaeformis.AAC.13
MIRLENIYTLVCCCLLFPALIWCQQDDDTYETRFLIGTGIYDCTGPAGQINMMGYAKPEQTTAGIHQRLRARAFILAKKANPRAGGDSHIIPIGPRRQHGRGNHRWSSSQSSSSSSSSTAWERWLMFWDRSHTSGLRVKYNEDPLHFLNASETVCFVSIDTGMGSDLLNIRVLERLKTLLPEEAQSLCSMETLSISGTHTHR